MQSTQTVSEACKYRTERITIHPTAQSGWWDSFNVQMESTTPKWADAKSGCKLLGLGSSAPRKLQWDGVLTPGEHWLYTNEKNGLVRFNVPALRQWQAATTLEAFNSTTGIETYDS